MKDFHKLKVWEKAHKLTLSIYLLTKDFPKDEQYGLTSQMRRASSSIPTNIVEGCGHNSQAEFNRFLHLAMGSSSELEYQLILSHDLQYMNNEIYLKVSTELYEVRRMLNSLIQKVRHDGEILKLTAICWSYP
jgi:four helix bundle protein